MKPIDSKCPACGQHPVTVSADYDVDLDPDAQLLPVATGPTDVCVTCSNGHRWFLQYRWNGETKETELVKQSGAI